VRYSIRLLVVVLVAAFIAPAVARAENRFLDGTYQCKVNGNSPLNTGQVFVDATISLTTGSGGAFQSGVVNGMKTVAIPAPLSVSAPQSYSNSLGSGTFALATFNGNGFFQLNWDANSFDFPAPDVCRVRTTVINPSGRIVTFILTCFQDRTFPFSGTCTRQ